MCSRQGFHYVGGEEPFADLPPEGGTANRVDGDVSGSLLQAGVINGDVHLHQPRAAVSLPHRAGVAPRQAAAFQDRADTTRLLVQALESGNAAVLTGQPRVHTGVVPGLGGVGKTQSAPAYAQRLWTAGELDVWGAWVTAGRERRSCPAAHAWPPT